MILLLIGTVMLFLGVVMDYARDVSKKNEQIWFITGAFLTIGVIIEQIAIHFMDYNAMEMIRQWIVGVWVFGMPIESLYLYFVFPYLVLIVYYGYIKESVEDKILSPFKVYSKR